MSPRSRGPDQLRDVYGGDGHSQHLQATGRHPYRRRGNGAVKSGRPSPRYSDADEAPTTAPPERTRMVSPGMAQEPSDGDTCFYPSPCGILGSRSGLAGRAQAAEQDNYPPTRVEGRGGQELGGLHPRETRSIPSPRRQGSSRRAGGDTIEGVDYPLTLTPHEEVMAFVRSRIVCYVCAFGISRKPSGYPDVYGHIPLDYYAVTVRMCLDQAPGVRLRGRGPADDRELWLLPETLIPNFRKDAVWKGSCPCVS